MKNASTKMITISALVMAGFIAVMYVNQGFAFGPFQIRFASAFYAMAFLFPFLVIPIGLANSLSNLFFGGLGVLDIVGGLGVGILTGALVALVRKMKLPMWMVIPPIILAPGFIVPLWLSPLTGMPYWLLVGLICGGQTPPAILGFLLIKALSMRKLDGRLEEE